MGGVHHRAGYSVDVLTALFAGTLLLSAALVFFVEPMFAKMVLPLLGGSPAVWNTCVVFFQATMLGGYAYAHATSSWLTIRQQAALHTFLLLLVGFSLPVAIPAGWVPPVDRSPIPWLLSLAVVAVGGPFFVASASAPLLQKWFSRTDHPSAADPYFLYSASNVGSIMALLLYPLFVEPSWSLPQQSRIWTAGYALFAVLTLCCARAAWTRAPAMQGAAQLPDAGVVSGVTPLTWTLRARWLALSAVPSSLLLAVTTYVSTDIAAVPLLWTIPLSLYLLSFVFSFAPTQILPLRGIAAAMPFAILLLVLSMIAGLTTPAWLLVPLHLIVFFVCALVLHAELASRRPDARNLTEFYLWLSAGGVLGGVLNTFVAPVLFTSVVEYPLALVLACALRSRPGHVSGGHGWFADGMALAVLVAAGVAITQSGQFGLVPSSIVPLLLGLVVASCVRLAASPVSFSLSIAVMFIVGGLWPASEGELLMAQRSFFGVHRVRMDPDGRGHSLFHGSTLHGRQALDATRRREPLTYFHRSGPIGQVMSVLDPRLDNGRIGVVGLGAGSLAAYARRGQTWTFFEIDPTVTQIARTPDLFTYISDCGAVCDVELGDARLSIAKTADASFDVLILDAFSSDGIPVHLITREALGLYLSKLADGGVIAFHVSNRHLMLRPVLAALAEERQIPALVRLDPRSDDATGRLASEWVVMARTRDAFRSLVNDSRWVEPQTNARRAWTDDFSDVLSTFKF